MTVKTELHSLDLFLGWTLGLSKGSYGNKDMGATEFNQLFWASPNKIVKRLCSKCAADYKEIFYRRYTSVTSFPVYDYMKQNWKLQNNLINRDFGIFSSYTDALAKRNAWKFCNYDDPGIGFPRDCGKNGAVGGQWNSWTRGGKDVAYYIEAGGEEPSLQKQVITVACFSFIEIHS